ncbi:MAG: U32 family peptidase [Actinomycetota bacterium]|nr:U32 family peptidase [Actinomycetota bacterium]
MNNIKLPELLVPANNLNTLKYAINYGADAVYVGGKDFNLRSIRGNFSFNQLKQGIDYARQRKVKVYFTLNSIVAENQLDSLVNFIEQLKSINPDALIVADTGVFALVRKLWPEALIHISTQANTSNSMAVNFWARLGAKRINMAREVTFNDLKEIKGKAQIEIEVFAHGALCISYSGRCMLSKYMSGRDANQGKCAHSCRWKYYLMEEERPNLFFPVISDHSGTYIYNSRDLCLLSRLKDLVNLKIDSLKIEGRMKTENYVGQVTWVYRKALDYIKDSKLDQEKIEYLIQQLDKASHRNFTLGFMFLKERQELEDNDNVGYIKKYSFAGVYKDYSAHFNGPVISVKNQFKLGQILDIVQPFKDPVEVKVNRIINDKAGQEIDCANPNDEIVLPGIGNIDKYSLLRVKLV